MSPIGPMKPIALRLTPDRAVAAAAAPREAAAGAATGGATAGGCAADRSAGRAGEWQIDLDVIADVVVGPFDVVVGFINVAAAGIAVAGARVGGTAGPPRAGVFQHLVE